jgi:hypothetical protein
MRSIFQFRTATGLALVLTSAMGMASCASELTRTGSSSAYLVVDSIQAAPGAKPDQMGSPLYSDVITNVRTLVNGQSVFVPTVFSDVGQARVSVALKNQSTPTGPSSVNTITINRYHVEFRRADGRNTPGVDVPYAFDGATTVSIAPESFATVPFEVVRHQAKEESPLRNMVGNGGAQIISTIAEITFYGRDQAGNEVTASGLLSVNFGDFGDPQ